MTTARESALDVLCRAATNYELAEGTDGKAWHACSLHAAVRAFLREPAPDPDAKLRALREFVINHAEPNPEGELNNWENICDAGAITDKIDRLLAEPQAEQRRL